MNTVIIFGLLTLALPVTGAGINSFDRQAVHQERFESADVRSSSSISATDNRLSLPLSQTLTDIQISESISPARFDQSEIDLVRLKDGRWLAAWQDNREGYLGIYWQLLDDSGAPLGANESVAVSPTGNNYVEPQLAIDTLGRVYLFYRDRTGGLIYGSRYTGNLLPDLAPFIVNDTSFNSFAGPFAFDVYPNGRTVAVWENYSILGSTIQARIISDAGSFLTAPITVNTDGGAASHWVPSVAVEPASGFLVAWEDYRNANADIFIRLFSGAGAAIGSDLGIVPSPANTASQYAPQVVLLDTDRYGIAWIDARTGQQVFAQEYNTNTGLVGANFPISSDTTATAWDASLNMADDGVLTFVWASFGATNQTLFHRFPSGLGGSSSTAALAPVTPGRQWGPELSAAADGLFGLVRTEIVGDEPDVTFAVFDSLGSLIQGTGLILNDDTVGALSFNPKIRATSDRWNVILYTDQRFDDGDIFAHRINDGLELESTSQRINLDNTGNLQADPSLAVIEDSEVFAVWVDSRPIIGQSGQRIFGRYGDQFGNFYGPEIMISDTLRIESKQAPRAALSPTGQGLVVWLDNRDATPAIYGRWIDQGQLDGTAFTITSSDHIQPRSIGVFFADQKFFVLWHDADAVVPILSGKSYRVDKSPGPAFTWQPPIATAALEDASADMNISGELIVAWAGTADTTRELYVVRLDTLGNAITNATAVATNPLAAPDDPAVGIDENGFVAVTWIDRREGKRKAYFKILDDNLVATEIPRPVSDADPAFMQQPNVSADRGQAWFVWADPRVNGLNIFAASLLYDPTDAGENDDPVLPRAFTLNQNYPNPFNPSTVISFELPRQSEVELTVYNLLGQRVRILLNKQLPAGEHTMIWDGTDNSGTRVASGVYFYRLTAGTFVQQKKMILLK